MKTAFVRHLIVCAAALVLADAWADTWIDPDTGYTWTYRITGNTAEIYNGGFCAVLPEPAGAVTIPSVLGGKPVASIGQHAFYGCSGLACVTIPDCVISIEEEAFDGCSSSLFDVTTISGVRLVDGWVVGNLGALEGDLNLIGVRGIANHAFDGCRGLTSVTIGDDARSIGAYAFYGCSGLTSVTIGSGVVSVDAYAFEGCYNLKAVHTPSIEAWCRISFYGKSDNPLAYAHNLYVNGKLVKDLKIPEGVVRIGVRQFIGCTSIESVEIPDSLTSIVTDAFDGCNDAIFDTSTIPGLKLVDGWVIECSTAISGSLDLAGVRGIGWYALSGCSSLTGVTIPDGVKCIWEAAFYGCKGLTSVWIPSSVINIEDRAFSGCSGLSRVIFEGDAPLCRCPFSGVASNCVAYVGRDSAGWGVDIPGEWNGIRIAYIGEEVKEEYTIIFNSFVDGMEIAPRTRFYGETIGELPVIEVDRYGYTFGGWENVNAETIVTSNMTISAVWHRNVYTVSFDAHAEGEEIGNVEKFYEESFGDLPQPARSGHVFLGWYTDAFGGEEIKATDKVMSDITLHAHWAEGPFEIEVGGAQWSYQTYSGVATIISATANEDSLSIPEMLGGAVVVEIPTACFAQVANLKCLAIPGSVTNIGAYAFCNCTNLEEVVFNEGLEKIGDGAFANCKRLKAVSLPSTVVDLGSKMISNCGRTYVEDGALLCGTNFVDEVVHDDGGPDDEYEYHSTNITATSAWDYGLSYSFMCSTNIDFVYKRNADQVSIVCSTNILFLIDSEYYGRGVFEGCQSLESILLNDGLRKIGAGAFKDCTSLRELVVPETVTEIGGHCERTVQTMRDSCSAAFDFLSSAVHQCLSSEQTVMQTETTNSCLGLGFVQGCIKLVSVALPPNLHYLGPYAFAGCTSLTAVDLPDSLRTISEGTFSGCSALETVRLPESLDLIGGYEFTSCSSRVHSYDSLSQNGVGPSTITSDQEISVQYDEEGGVLYSDMLVLNGGAPSCLSRYVKTNVTRNADDTFTVEEILVANNLTTNVTSCVAEYDDIDFDNRWQDGVETVFVPKRRQVVVDSDGCDRLGELMDFIGAKCSGLDGEVMTARRRFYPDAPVYNGKIFAPESGVFFGCRNLRAIVLPNTVRRIADYAFYNCSALETINVPDSLAVVGYRAFGGTTNLPEVGAPWLRYPGWIDDMVDDGHPYDEIADVFDVVRGMVYSVKADLSEEEKLYVARVAASSVIYALEQFCIADSGDPFDGIDNMLAMMAEIFNAVGITDLDSNERSLLIDNVVYCVERLYRRISGSEVNGRTVDVSPINSFSGLGNAMAGLSEVFYSVGRALADEERVRYACVATASAASLLCAVTDEDYPAISLETYEGVGDIYAGLCNVYSNLSAKLSVGRKQELSDEISQAAISANAAMSKSGKPVGSALDDVQFFMGECINYLNNAKDDVIPVLLADTTQEEFASIVEDIRFADSRLPAELLMGTEVYTAFREWAGGVKGATGDALAGATEVVANEHAAAAYLLGAERLFENEPTVEIDELAVADGENAGTTAMTVAVTVRDGESAVAVNAAKVAAMFEATGDLGDWTGAAKLTPTVTTTGTDASGKMTFVVTPGDGTASKAFLRIKR